MTLSEQERVGWSRRGDGHDEHDDAPHTAALPTFDTHAFGSVSGAHTAGFDTAHVDTATFDTATFDTATFDGAGMHTAGFETTTFDRSAFDPSAFDPSAFDAATSWFDGVSTSWFDGAPAETAEPAETSGEDGSDSATTSHVPAYDAHAAETTSYIPAHGAPDETPAETTSYIPPHPSLPDGQTAVMEPATSLVHAPAAPAPIAPPAAPAPVDDATAVTPAERPQVVVGSRGTRRATSSATAQPAPTTPPVAPPKKSGLLGLATGPHGVMLRLLLVLVLLAGAAGAVVVTDPQVLTGFRTSVGAADGPLTTLSPSPPAADGTAPAGGLLPNALPLPPGSPLGAPPPALAPVPLPGAPLPAAPALPAQAPGLGVGTVLGALFDAAQGPFATHFDNSGGSGLIQNGYYPSVVPNPMFPGRQAFQFAIGPGGLRSEVLPVGPGTQPVDGDQQFVRYSALLSPDFPTDTPYWQIILQWHHQSDTGSPPIALQVTRGMLEMVSGGDDAQVIGPISPGQPINLTMQIRFSMNPALGAITVFRDGRPTGVTNWHPVHGTMFTPGAYLKMGMYRSESIMQGGALTITDLKIGQSPQAIGGLGDLH